MPLSSGAHGWSLTYINKPPRPRMPPEHYFYTVEIPHSHKKYRGNTAEDDIPPVGRVGQHGTRRPQWHPVNHHRLLEPDPFNFTRSRWQGELDQRNSNDFKLESSPDTGKKAFAPLRQQEITTGPIKAEQQQFTTNSFPSVHRTAPPLRRRKLVYPVSKFKDIKPVQKDDFKSHVSKPREQSVLAKENGKDGITVTCPTIPNVQIPKDIEVHRSNVIACSIANSIINEKDEKRDEIVMITEGLLSPVSEGKEDSENNNKPLVEDIHNNEDSGRGSSPERSISPKQDTLKIVPVIIPRPPIRDSESSRTSLPASSRCDTKRQQETILENSSESLRNVKNAGINNIDKDNPKPEASISVKKSNANYMTNSTANNAQNNSRRVKKSDQGNHSAQNVGKKNCNPPIVTITQAEGNDVKKKKNDQIEQKGIQKNRNVIIVKPSPRENSVDTRESNDNEGLNKSGKTEVSGTKQTKMPVNEPDSCKDQVKSTVTFNCHSF